MVDDGDDAGQMRPLEQQFYGTASLRSEIDREFVHVQVDVLIHHLLTHLLRVLADEGQAGSPMRERVLDAATYDTVDPVPDGVRQRAADDNAAKRNRRAGLSFPELAQIDDLPEPLRRVGEPVLVDDQPGIETSVENSRFDVREQQLRLVQRRWKRQAEQEIRGRVFAGYRDAQCS